MERHTEPDQVDQGGAGEGVVEAGKSAGQIGHRVLLQMGLMERRPSWPGSRNSSMINGSRSTRARLSVRRPFRCPIRRTVELLLIGILFVALLAPGAASGETLYYGPDGSALPFRSEQEVLEFLKTADFVWRQKLGAGTNKRKRKVLLEKDGIRAHAILRTGYEVRDVGSEGFVDSYLSEVAAYELSRLLGLDSVPPVVRRKGGSLQLWIENATTDASRRKAGTEPEDPQRFERQLQVMHVFDNLIANTDRNPGNVLIDGSGKVWCIDHTRSFAGQRVLKYPERITGCDRNLWQRLRTVTDQEIKAAVGPYGRRYLEALLERRRLLVQEIGNRIAEAGEEAFLFSLRSPG